jgi:hypothetical protein
VRVTAIPLLVVADVIQRVSSIRTRVTGCGMVAAWPDLSSMWSQISYGQARLMLIFLFGCLHIFLFSCLRSGRIKMCLVVCINTKIK